MIPLAVDPRRPMLHPWTTRGRCAVCGAARTGTREDEECPDRLRAALDQALRALEAVASWQPTGGDGSPPAAGGALIAAMLRRTEER